MTTRPKHDIVWRGAASHRRIGAATGAAMPDGLATLAVALLWPLLLGGNEVPSGRPVTWDAPSVSVCLEVRSSLRRGAAYLLPQQDRQGGWTADPCVTAMVLRALACLPAPADERCRLAAAAGGRYLATLVGQSRATRQDATGAEPVRVTAQVLTALSLVGGADARPAAEQARSFLIASQCLSVPETDPQYGGFARGKGMRCDLVTTHLVSVALSSAECALLAPGPLARDGAWRQAAARFVERCLGNAAGPGASLLSGKAAPRCFRNTLAGSETLGAEPNPRLLGWTGLDALLLTGTSPDAPAVLAAWGCLDGGAARASSAAGDASPKGDVLTAMAACLGRHDALASHAGSHLRQWKTYLANWLLAHQKGDGRWTAGDMGVAPAVDALATAQAMAAMALALPTDPLSEGVMRH